MQVLEVITIGFPFCGFKIMTALHFLDAAQPPIIRGSAAILLLAGILDLIINAVNLFGLIALRRRLLNACLFSNLLAKRGWGDMGDSLDVLLSFSIVAFVVGRGITRYIPGDLLPLWNACVVLNVMGAGLSRFGTSLMGLVRVPR